MLEKVTNGRRRRGAILAATVLLSTTTSVALADTGTLVERHGDTATGAEVDRSYVLHTARGDRELGAHQRPDLVGQRVDVPTSGGLAATQAPARAAGVARVAAAPKVGPHTVLVILGTLSDARTQPFTADEARSAIFTAEDSAAAAYAEQSGGVVTLTGRTRADGDVAGWFDLPVSSDNCDEDAIAAAADAAARGAGIEPDAYDHVIYLFPQVASCGWAGLGELPGRRMWSNGYLDAGVIVHELGHNMGAHHASSLRCMDAGGQPVTLSDNCTASEYGDPFDVMGSNWHGLMSSWHRAQVGQLPLDRVQPIRQAGTYALSAVDDPAAPGAKLVLVPLKEPHKPVDGYLALELRGASSGPFDSFADAPVATGVTVREVPRLTTVMQSKLLDATPDTDTFSDAPVMSGASLTDAAHGVTVHVSQVADGQATVDVTMPTLYDDVPPAAPGWLDANGDTRQVDLVWPAAADDEAVDHYEVVRDGQVLATTPGTDFVDRALAGRRQVAYTVVAVDTSGNRSTPQSQRVRLDDGVAPVAPRSLRVHRVRNGMALTWTAATDDRGIAAYVVLRDGHRIAQTPRLAFTDRRARPGAHRWSVVALDEAGNRSDRRNVRGVARAAKRRAHS